MIGNNDMEPWKFESVTPYSVLRTAAWFLRRWEPKTTTEAPPGDPGGLRRRDPLASPARGHRQSACFAVVG